MRDAIAADGRGCHGGHATTVRDFQDFGTIEHARDHPPLPTPVPTASSPRVIALVAVRIRHAVAAVRDLPRALGLLPARPDARLRDLRVRRARHADPRRPRVRRGRPAAGPARRARRADGHDASSSCSPTRSPGCSSPAACRASRPASRSGAASAALLDLHPRRDPASVGPHQRRRQRRRAWASACSLGARWSSSLPAPRVLPYVVLLVLFAIAFVGALAMPEPVEPRGARSRLTPQRPSVPPARAPPVRPRRARRPVVVVDRRPVPLPRPAALARRCSTAPTTWSPASASSCSPARARSPSSPSGAPRRGRARRPARSRWPPGMLLIVASAADGLRGPLPRRRVVGGAGFGVAFLGALRALSAAIPPEHRAQVMSAFYVVAYAARSRCPASWPGILVTPLGLMHDVRDLRQRRRRARAARRLRGLATRPVDADSGPVEAAHRRDGAGLGRRAAVDGAERPAEPRGIAEAPARRQRGDRQPGELRVGEVAARTLQAPRPDPGGDRRPLGLEQLVDVARGDEVRLGDPLRARGPARAGAGRCGP